MIIKGQYNQGMSNALNENWQNKTSFLHDDKKPEKMQLCKGFTELSPTQSSGFFFYFPAVREVKSYLHGIAFPDFCMFHSFF